MNRLEDIGIALAVAVAVPVAQALTTFSEDTFAHPTKWLQGLAVGVATALGLRLLAWVKARQPA